MSEVKYRVEVDEKGRYYAAGISAGVINSSVFNSKQEKPFVIIAGVVYINASKIKEFTL